MCIRDSHCGSRLCSLRLVLARLRSRCGCRYWLGCSIFGLRLVLGARDSKLHLCPGEPFSIAFKHVLFSSLMRLRHNRCCLVFRLFSDEGGQVKFNLSHLFIATEKRQTINVRFPGLGLVVLVETANDLELGRFSIKLHLGFFSCQIFLPSVDALGSTRPLYIALLSFLHRDSAT